ncbi:MAG: YgiT-type zinc finger protein [Chloroflexi bacterium]|nr:YgiT-type zinc finger protein [Chloroflexota bacterium]
MRTTLPANPETCPRCFVGRIERVKAVLTRVVNNQVLSVPDFPAWECDVCHAFMYDPRALLELQQVLTAKPSHPVRKTLRTAKSASPEAKLKKPAKLNRLP